MYNRQVIANPFYDASYCVSDAFDIVRLSAFMHKKLQSYKILE